LPRETVHCGPQNINDVVLYGGGRRGSDVQADPIARMI
jgi:hypothetical protein